MENQTPQYSQNFFKKDELELIEKFMRDGYVIVPADDRSALDQIQNTFVENACTFFKLDKPKDPKDFLDNIHKTVDVSKLNEFRLSLFNQFNATPWARAQYFATARRYLEVLVGNELAMQKRINLSIQLPNDASSLLPVHSDVWSGDSPFEFVVWIPLVDVYRTKSMFFLPPEKNEIYSEQMAKIGSRSEDLYKAIEPHLTWLEIPYGHILVFSHIMMHGNRVNTEATTRWSMNCRFKGLFTPYWDKRLADFFEPITLRPASRLGMEYKLPGGFSE